MSRIVNMNRQDIQRAMLGNPETNVSEGSVRGERPLYVPERSIYNATRALGEFVAERNVTDLVLIDRAARLTWVGLYAYLKLQYPGVKRPNIYFINPRIYSGENPPLTPSQTASAISSRANHETSAEDTVMVFDTCVHTGEALEATVDVVEQVCGGDVLTGVFCNVGYDDSTSPIDFVYTYTDFELGCFPYSSPRLKRDPVGLSSSKNGYPIDGQLESRKRSGFKQLILEQHALAQV